MTTPQQAPHLAEQIIGSLRIGARAEDVAAALVAIAEAHPPRVAIAVALRVAPKLLPMPGHKLWNDVIRIVEAGTR